MARGRFIVVDGCEGSGKTTQLKRLRERYPEAVFTREPGGSPYAEAIRDLILYHPEAKHADDSTLLSLFYAARFDHLRATVAPALAAGKDVISDRFDSTTFSYQIHARDSYEILPLFEAMRTAACRIAEPDSYVMLIVDPKISLTRKRAQAVAGGDRFNHLDEREHAFHSSACDGFTMFVEKYAKRGAFVDANQGIDDVFEALCAAIDAIPRPE